MRAYVPGLQPLLSLGLVVLIPHFLFQALAHGKYVAGFRQRLGAVPQVNGKPVIWLHCVSVGETQAARPLAQRLKQEFPHHALVVSTITLTGQKLARDVFRTQAESVFYFPFDWRWSVRRALKTINPAAVLIMETELWPNFLRECKARRDSSGAGQWENLAAVVSQVHADQVFSAASAFVVSASQ